MPSATASSPLPADPPAADAPAWAAARRLCPEPVRAVLRTGGGGNSRLYRVESDTARPYALKSYPPRTHDPRDRLGQEFAALAFVTRHDSEDRVPRPVAVDAGAGFGLYAWIEGEPVVPAAADIDAVLAFTRRLHELRGAAGADALAPASEACLSLDEIATQIARRRRRLAEVADDEPGLRACLEDGFDPALAAALARAGALYREAGLDPDAAIGPAQRTLSPSDFGFHNALRRADGRIVFLDFEYFGWDDPVRLVADFHWHPGMRLSDALKDRFVDGAAPVFAGDPGFPVRLVAQWPLVGLRWCMILLNEFLPERWLGRVHAGQNRDRRDVLARQLSKTRTYLEKVRQVMQQPPSALPWNRRDGE